MVSSSLSTPTTPNKPHNNNNNTTTTTSEKKQMMTMKPLPSLSQQHAIITALMRKNPLEGGISNNYHSDDATQEAQKSSKQQQQLLKQDIEFSGGSLSDAAAAGMPRGADNIIASNYSSYGSDVNGIASDTMNDVFDVNNTTAASNEATTASTPRVALIESKWWNRYMELVEEQSRQDYEEKNEDQMDVDEDGAAEQAAKVSMPLKEDPNSVLMPPINNEPLLANLQQWKQNPEKNSPVLSNDVTERTHFEYISVEAFEQLLEWYGGGPRIYRNVVKQEDTSLMQDDDTKGDLIADLYPLHIQVAHHKNKETKHDFHDMEVFKGLTVGKFKKLLIEKFNLNSEHTRIWEAFCGSPYQLQDDETKTLAEIDAQRDPRDRDTPQQFLIEGRNSMDRWALKDKNPTTVGGPTSMFNGSSAHSRFPSSFASPSFRSFSYNEDSGDNRITKPGLCGLSNLGNTCFMNSALQCLTKTPQIRDYFTSSEYMEEINKDNPLGMNGEIAKAFGKLMNLMWSGKHSNISPKGFKHTIGKFAPQFVGYQQHDSCELVQYLLDGLHEDLNRIVDKPYTQIVEGRDLDQNEAADRAWKVHLLRNDSIIVDRFKGQLKSTLVCPKCNNVSVTFDPFMYLPLPLPDSESVMEFTVAYYQMSRPWKKFALKVGKHDTIGDVRPRLAEMAGVDPASLVFADVVSASIYAIYDNKKSCGSIQSTDTTCVYELPNIKDAAFHDGKPKKCWASVSVEIPTRSYYSRSDHLFAHPLLLPYVDGKTTNKELYDDVLKNCLSLLTEDEIAQLDVDLNKPSTFLPSDDQLDSNKHLITLKDSFGNFLQYNDQVSESNRSYSHSSSDLKANIQGSAVHIGEKTLSELMAAKKTAHVVENDKSVTESKQKNKSSVSLDRCFNLFQTSEQLGKQDMWRCPTCKEPVQAEKTIQLWKLPEVLVIQLKRFQFHQFSSGKINTMVDYPLHDLDLSSFVPESSEHKEYNLFGVSNHFGGLGGGHYIAHCKVGDQWYRFDDSMVRSVPESEICSSDAYLLFYTSKKITPVHRGSKKNGKELVKEWGLEEHAQQ